MKRIKPSTFPYRYLLILLIIGIAGTHSLSAQTTEAEQDVEKTNMGRFISLQFSAIQPVAMGNNFANEALSQKIGYNFAIRFYIYKSFFLGAEGGSFTADVEDTSLVGDYDSANANTYGLSAGYTYTINKSNDIDAGLTYGFANYRNKKNDVDDRFVDHGNFTKIQLQYNYKLNDHFSVFVLAGFRYDFLDIDTSPAIDNFINEANYLTLGLGVQFNQITDKSKLW